MKNSFIKLFVIISVISISFLTHAQKGVEPGSFGYYQDALRYSQTNFSGMTARVQGFAGAQTALGGDMSSLLGNPAGIGMYNRFDFNLTPSLSFRTANSSFLGKDKNDISVNAAINNIGLVIPFMKDDIVPGDWRGSVFGISLARTNSFQQQFSYEGNNNANSMIDYFVQRSNGIPRAQIESEVDKTGNPTTLESLAYYTYLIDPNLDNVTYSNLILGTPVNQKETVKRTGTSKQFNMVLGGNYKDRFYIGGNIAFSFFKYIQNRTYQETMLAENNVKMRSFTMDDELQARGTGINASVGMIYRFNDWIRAGASFQTPTYYFTINEIYNTSMTANFDNYQLPNGDRLNKVSNKMPEGNFTYKLATPFKASFGLAFFVNKNGFITADVDYIDYTNSVLQSTDIQYSFSEDNQTIKNIYKPTFNFRVGGEYRISLFRLRAGYALFANPYNEKYDNLDRNTHAFTLGAGMRTDSYYFDVAFVQNRFKTAYSPYNLYSGNSPSALTKNIETNVLITWGFFF